MHGWAFRSVLIHYFLRFLMTALVRISIAWEKGDALVVRSPKLMRTVEALLVLKIGRLEILRVDAGTRIKLSEELVLAR